jgi:hypothetical protein
MLSKYTRGFARVASKPHLSIPASSRNSRIDSELHNLPQSPDAFCEGKLVCKAGFQVFAMVTACTVPKRVRFRTRSESLRKSQKLS